MSKPSSQPIIGFPTACFLVVANMIGAGVFTTSGFSLASLGSRSLVIAAWVCGGMIAICGAISYGRLARLLSESGGEYLFLSRFIHPLVGFIAGWVSLLWGFTGAIAFVATAFATYLLPDAGNESAGFFRDTAVKSVAINAILLFGLIHAFHVRGGAWIQNLVVIAKLCLLALFIGYAAFQFGEGTWPGIKADEISSEFSLYVFASSIVWISLSFSGFNAAVYISGEVKHAQRTVPLALFTGTLIVTCFYIGLNAIFIYAPTPDAIAGQERIAAIAAEVIGGERLATLTRAIICLALLSSVSSMLLAGPRVYAKMAEDGVFPRMFAKEDSLLSAPTAAIMLQCGLACLLVLVAELQDLLSYLSFTLSISAACTVGCVFLSVKGKELNSASWQSDLIYKSCAAIYVGATLILAALAAIDRPLQLVAGFVTVISGIGAFVLIKSLRPKRGPKPER